MRTSLRRALAGASATVLTCAALVVGAAAPASAEDSTICPELESTRLLTANDGAYKAWLYQPASGDVYVCFGAAQYTRGAFVFRTGLSGSLVPSVTPDVDASDCNRFFELQDPVDLLVQWEWSSFTPPFYFCLGVEGTAVGISVTAANGTADPSPELWLDYGHVVTDHYCAAFGACSFNEPVRVL